MGDLALRSSRDGRAKSRVSGGTLSSPVCSPAGARAGFGVAQTKAPRSGGTLRSGACNPARTRAGFTKSRVSGGTLNSPVCSPAGARAGFGVGQEKEPRRGGTKARQETFGLRSSGLVARRSAPALKRFCIFLMKKIASFGAPEGLKLFRRVCIVCAAAIRGRAEGRWRPATTSGTRVRSGLGWFRHFLLLRSCRGSAAPPRTAAPRW